MNIWRSEIGSDPNRPDTAFDLNIEHIATVTYTSERGVILSAEVELSSGRIINYTQPDAAQRIYDLMRPKP